MTSVLFICHGNICRSTMAEFVMKDILTARGMGDVRVESAATSREELGNDTYPGTKRVLDAHGVPYAPRRARQTTRDDYDAFDYIVGMDAENMRGMRRWLGIWSARWAARSQEGLPPLQATSTQAGHPTPQDGARPRAASYFGPKSLAADSSSFSTSK